jgi:glycosyltransferase involved in cell wall biosynthesis
MVPDAAVVIPTYNRHAMVCEAVKSVLAQRDAKFELIVVDDGSTDGTLDELTRIAAVANDHAQWEMMRIERTPNRGPAAARNTGVAIAAARFVAFLDSDDLWLPHKLNRQIAFMREHPEYAISQTEEIWMRDGRRMNPGARHRKRAGDLFADSLLTCLISPSAVIMRADLFRESGGFDEDMGAAEDYDLWLRFLTDHEVGLIDEQLVIRRAGHPGQLSATVPALDRFRVLALLKLLAREDLAPERRIKVCEVLSEKCAIYAKGLERRARVDEADFFLEVARNAFGAWLTSPDAALLDATEATRAMLTRTAAKAPCAAPRPESKDSPCDFAAAEEASR